MCFLGFKHLKGRIGGTRRGRTQKAKHVGRAYARAGTEQPQGKIMIELVRWLGMWSPHGQAILSSSLSRGWWVLDILILFWVYFQLPCLTTSMQVLQCPGSMAAKENCQSHHQKGLTKEVWITVDVPAVPIQRSPTKCYFYILLLSSVKNAFVSFLIIALCCPWRRILLYLIAVHV